MLPSDPGVESAPLRGAALLAATVALLGGRAHGLPAQLLDVPPSLDTVPVPRPTDLGQWVKNEAAAIRLGKALFWDQQVGSDGRTACATCHHAAGADSRVKNALHPGVGGIFETIGPGSFLRPIHFPILTDDVVGSQGVVERDFTSIRLGGRVDVSTSVVDPLFGLHPQVTRRNAPSVINSIFNREQFWDGRARSTFNGRDGSGSGTGASVLLALSDGRILAVPVDLTNSSAASQAVEPANDGVEMAWSGRGFSDLGKKLLSLRPLATQRVHAQDGVLGAFRDPAGIGLRVSYARLVQEAFRDRWWRSSAILDRAGNQVGTGVPRGLDEFSLMEANFSLFWGLAIQLYEATLVASDTPFDRFARGDLGALTASQQRGLELFLGGRTGCASCHGGSEFSDATVAQAGSEEAFTFIGVDPRSEDQGRAGMFKTPQLRNVELTGPYFHNGKYLTLRQVVDFYDRGGDVANDTIEPLGLDESEKDALVDFLIALTDPRVRFQRAPFDHPSLNPVNRAPIPEVGAGGTSTPLPTFLGISPYNPGAR
jgi:cytochrome c peroxidase